MELFYNNEPFKKYLNESDDISDIDIKKVKIDAAKLVKKYGKKNSVNTDAFEPSINPLTNDTLSYVDKITATKCEFRDKVEAETTPEHGADFVPESHNSRSNNFLNEINILKTHKRLYDWGLIKNSSLYTADVEPAPDVINLDDDIDNNDERFNTYENDIIYKNGLKYLSDDNSRTPELTNAIKELATVHSDILNMYTNVPYEDWNDIKANKFKKLLEEYRVKLESLDNLLDNNHQWNTEEQEGNFNDLYWNVIQHDYDSYIRLVERHEHYIIYRANRIQLLMTLFEVVARPTLPHNKSAKMVFNYIARQCDGFPLFGNNKNNKYEEILTAEIHKHKSKFMEDIITFNTGGRVAYDNKDFSTIVIFYVFCRRMLFDIFNMFTSNNKYNGYEKYKNFYDDFCSGQIKAKPLEAMYNSIRSRIGKTDDYHNIMDQGTFDQQGLFESWWAEDVKWYHDNCPDRFTKDKITRINMIPTNVNACKVYYNGQGVYSNAKFYTGDIIEVCPARSVGKDSLYSKDMRDIVLEVIPNNKWVIPFGYCQYYTPAAYKKDANCSYEWNQQTDNIVIRALCDIPKNTELVMQIVKIS